MNIPAAALEAGARAIAQTTEPKDKWRYHIPEARAACLAMLRAWPGMTHMEPDLANGIIILPLTENPDAEA